MDLCKILGDNIYKGEISKADCCSPIGDNLREDEKERVRERERERDGTRGSIIILFSRVRS